MDRRENTVDNAVTRRERRAWERYNIYLPLLVKGRDISDQVVYESTITVNVSARGALFRSEHEFRPGQMLDIYIKPLVWGENTQHLRAKVMRVDKDMQGFGGSHKRGVGIALTKRAHFFSAEPTEMSGRHQEPETT